MVEGLLSRARRASLGYPSCLGWEERADYQTTHQAGELAKWFVNCGAIPIHLPIWGFRQDYTESIDAIGRAMKALKENKKEATGGISTMRPIPF